MGIELLDTTREHLVYISNNLRDIDLLEISGASGRSGIEALGNAVSLSEFSVTFMKGDAPVAILGVAKSPWGGCPWMLGTTDISLNARHILKLMPNLILRMHKCCGNLVNYVSIHNEESIKVLISVGFEIHPEEFEMLNGVKFYRFSREVL